MRRVVILTGAGISAESGLKTFRDNNGLWENHRVEEVATPEAFHSNPSLVYRFYNLRRAQLKEGEPNLAHKALAKLEREFSGEVYLITQNVDDLHERAGTKNIHHMHGELRKVRCLKCGEVMAWSEDLNEGHLCSFCGERPLRPHIVWFGEQPFNMEKCLEKLVHCDLFLSIGTSGNVYPAAGFVQVAKQSGAKCIELNLEPSIQSSFFDSQLIGKATVVLPSFVEEILSGKYEK
ncbi:MAG: NAD-dependent deacylase [Bacteriovoracaceae bacterium]